MPPKELFSRAEKDEVLRSHLNLQNTKERLDAMKRLIASISKGKDVSMYFPEVVKSIITDTHDVKKLVYTFILHYAERKQDEVLLSINSFQKDLTHRNQYIRAMALRVMSSIRVPMISQIVTFGIKKCAKDPSAYVRKAAAMAIPKVYHMEHSEKDALVEVIEGLLDDVSTMVIGTAVYAFCEVCPERIDLLHKRYRRFCRVVADCDEWGQVVLINTLLRYARTQFLSPFNDKDTSFAAREGEGSEDEDDDFLGEKKSGVLDYDLDNDHRLLLRSAQPLLQSRNSAVVMAVASLFFHMAPPTELPLVAKALVRVYRNHREITYVVLKNILALSQEKPALFAPYYKDFLVSMAEPAYLRDMKLAVLTQLASTVNVMGILREFQTYIRHEDRAFGQQVVKSIGKLALRIPDVCETCLNGLLGLLHHKDDAIAGESAMVIQLLLQVYPEEYRRVVLRLCRTLDSISEPNARASIVWTVAEYSDKVPRHALSIFKKLTKAFTTEENVTKLQILNLGTKLYLRHGDSVEKIFLYLLTLAKYDMSYDIRDRTRLISAFVLSDSVVPKLTQFAENVFLSKKPTPALEKETMGPFILGSLSLVVNHQVAGFVRLSDFPKEMPNPSLRNTTEDIPIKRETRPGKSSHGDDLEAFYDSDESGDSGKYSGDSDSELDRFFTDEESESDYTSESTDEDEDGSYDTDSDGSYTSEGDSEGSTDDESESDDEGEKEDGRQAKRSPKGRASKPHTPASGKKDTKKSDSSSLLSFDFDTVEPIAPAPAATMNLKPLAGSQMNPSSFEASFTMPPFRPRRVAILNPVTSGGLLGEAEFSRELSSYDVAMSIVRLVLKNTTKAPIESITVSGPTGVRVEGSRAIPSLGAGDSAEMSLHFVFGSRLSGLKFTVKCSKGEFSFTLIPSPGELMRPCMMSASEFDRLVHNLSGLQETKKTIDAEIDAIDVPSIVGSAAHVAPVSTVSEDGDVTYKFAARLLQDETTVLITVVVESDQVHLQVNCENSMFSLPFVSSLEKAFEED